MKMTHAIHRSFAALSSFFKNSHKNFNSQASFMRSISAVAVCFVLLLVSYTSKAQSWTNAIDIGSSPSNEWGQSVCTDTAGNKYFTGRFLNTVNFNPGGVAVNLVSAGSSDVYVTKYNAAGVFQWAVRAGGIGTDFGAGIATDGVNIYLVGNFANTATFGATTLTSNGGQDIYVAQLNATTGAFNWAVGFGGAGDDNGWSICIDTAGNPYIMGNYYNTATFGATVLTVNGGSASNTNDIYVASLNAATGAVNWATGGGTTADDASRSSGISYNAMMNTLVVASGIGNVPHQTAVFGTYTLTTTGNGDACVLELNPATGAFNHAVSFGTAGNGTTSCFADCYDANSMDVFITGTYNSNPSAPQSLTLPGAASLPVTKNDAMFTARYSVLNHNFVWAKAGTVNNIDNVNTAGFSIASDNKGGIYTTGFFVDTFTVGTYSLASAGLANIFVAKFTAAFGTVGYLLQGVGNNALYNNEGFGISCSKTGSLAATGAFATSCIFGTNTITSTGLQDIYLAFGTVPVYNAPIIAINTNYNICFSGTMVSLPYGADTGNPIAYSIIWDSAASAAGLMDMTNSALPAGSFSITVPSGLSGTYRGYFIVNNDTASGAIQTFSVTFNVTPVFTSPATNTSICDNSVFTYSVTTSTAGAISIWTRDSVAGISNATVRDSSNVISETLMNTTHDSVTVMYMDTLVNGGCYATQTLTVTVYPMPVLDSVFPGTSLCAGASFSLTQTSPVSGATIVWYRMDTTNNPAMSDTGNIASQVLLDSTQLPVTVMYTDSIWAYGCVNTSSFSINVNPVPSLTSSTTIPTICSGSMFSYVATSNDSLVVFAWGQVVDSNISPVTDSGMNDTINVILTNNSPALINVNYIFTLTLNSCSSTTDVMIGVQPYPQKPVIATYPTGNLCMGVNYMNFGALTAPDSITTYSWFANNAFVYDQAGQFALVNFPNADSAQVILSATIAGVGCSSYDTFNTVISSSDAPAIYVTYLNNSYICLPYTEKAFQWGYDNVSLDSTILTGEKNQDYYSTNPDPSVFYWVIATDNNGCYQKAYYNTPTGVTNINNNETTVKVYPNPAHDNIAVAIKGAAEHDVLMLQDVTGKTLKSVPVTNDKMEINVSDLSAGYYIISCYHQGTKMASTQFIKN